jgi:hypothetical protein
MILPCAAAKRSRLAAMMSSVASASPAAAGDRGEQLHALLAGAAVDVVERVDRRRHRAVQRQAARDRHARDRDRRRVRTVVDGRDQRRLEQPRLRRLGHLAAQHQPDHVGEAQVADQLLDRVAAHRDLARLDVDDAGRPPVARLLQALFGAQGRLRLHTMPPLRSAAISAAL